MRTLSLLLSNLCSRSRLLTGFLLICLATPTFALSPNDSATKLHMWAVGSDVFASFDDGPSIQIKDGNITGRMQYTVNAGMALVEWPTGTTMVNFGNGGEINFSFSVTFNGTSFVTAGWANLHTDGNSTSSYGPTVVNAGSEFTANFRLTGTTIIQTFAHEYTYATGSNSSGNVNSTPTIVWTNALDSNNLIIGSNGVTVTIPANTPITVSTLATAPNNGHLTAVNYEVSKDGGVTWVACGTPTVSGSVMATTSDSVSRTTAGTLMFRASVTASL